MKYRLGIGGKLLIAFGGISMLTVISALVGWIAFERAGRVQDIVVNETVPFLNQALSLAEISHRIIALSPSLTEATSESRRALEATEIFKQVRKLRDLLQELKNTGALRSELVPLRQTTERIVSNLIRQNDLVKTRIGLQEKFSTQAKAARDAVSQIVELSGVLVSNAATTTTATIANLYDMVESPAKRPLIFRTLDRLIEIEIDTLERMFELRHRSAVVGLLIGQLERTASPDEIAPLKADYARHLKIIERRILIVNDPYRKRQAEHALRSLRISHRAGAGMPIFMLREKILKSNVKIAGLASQNRSLSSRLQSHVENLVARSRNEMQLAAAESDAALNTGNFTLLFIAALSLAIATLIAWFYIRRKIARRIVTLSDVTGELARGNLEVDVHDSGNDELSDMAGVLKVFKANALAKQRLEKEQKQTEAELRRHKEHLEQLVSERTAQLREVNLRLGEEVERHEEARALAEQANRAKTAFLASMSHEIRTPISGILGILHLLNDEGLSREQKDRLDIIRASGETLLSIINDILDYSKIEAGHLDVMRTDFSIADLINDLVALMEVNAQRKGLTLSASIAGDIPPVLKGDPGHIRQVLMNLVGNAIKYTATGSVSIRAERLTGIEGLLVRFEVTDTGAGIPEDEQPHLFEAFYQPQTGQRNGGTGLGLSICHRLVRAIGGEIGVRSTPGHGSTFWMQLPFEPADRETPEAGQPDGAQPERAMQSLKVLLVEDNPVNREIAHAFLERHGHRVTEVDNGEEAVAAVEDGEFDVVLMDISLPGINGQLATRRIRALKDTKKNTLPVIAMSAHVFREEISNYLAAGMNAFLGKPFSPEQLAAVLRQVIVEPQTGPVIDVGKDEATTTAVTAIIDASVLEEDVAIIGTERTGRMVQLFLASSAGTVDKIRTMAAAGQWAEVEKLAHSLKSAAASLGLLKLGQSSRQIEIATREQQFDTIQLLVRALPGLMAHSCTALQKLQRELGLENR